MIRTKRQLFPAFLFVVALSSAALSQSINPKFPAPGEAPAGSPVARHGHLKVSNGKIVDKDNKPVQLRGMSFFWGNSGDGGRQFYNDNVVGWMIHDFKVDVLRAAVASFKETNGGGNEGYIDGDSSGQWNQLRTVVEGAIRRGVYVIVDWHTHTAMGSITVNGRNINLQSKAEEFFTNVAKTWGQYPNIIYEIFNEPDPRSPGPNNDWGSIKGYSEAVIGKIRAQNSPNVVIVGTPSWCSNLSGPRSSPISASQYGNIAYSLHFYSASHSFYSEATSTVAAGLAVFVSEFGLSEANGGGSISTGNTDTWLGHLNTNHIGWVNWAINAMGTGTNESSAMLKHGVANNNGRWSESDLSPSGKYIRDKLRASGSGITNTTYTVTVTNPSQGGTVTITNPKSGGFNYGDVATVKANPAQGWEFRNWTGDLTGAGTGTFDIPITGINLNVSAEFYNGGLIKNGAFSTGLEPWQQFISTHPTMQGEAQAPVISNAQLTTRITNQSGNPEHLYLWQNEIPLVGGKGYRLSFRAHADSNRKLAVNVANSTTRALKYMPTREIVVGTTPRDYEIDFVADASGNVAARVEFWYGVNPTNWTITNVKLVEGNYQAGNGDGAPYVNANDWNKPITSVRQNASAAAVKTAWSVVRTGSGLQLRGPIDNSGAKVSLYDIRGRLVKNVSLKNGQTFTLNKTVVPAGNYMLVVKNGSGKEAYKTRVSLVN